MAKTTTKKATKAVEAPKVEAESTATTVSAPVASQVFKVNSDTVESEIVFADGTPGTEIQFDYVHFKKLSDDFVATLKPANQKAYWLAFGEFDRRDHEANIALHSIGVDPLSKILDRPRGKNNPLVRDELFMKEKLGREWYVTWRIQGGEADIKDALEAGFTLMRHPDKAKGESLKDPDPFKWTGEAWKIPDGTASLQGDQIFNVMVVIRQKRWDDSLKAMSMASHNAYSQVKQQFFEGAENISRDMLGGKEKVIASDLDQTRAEEYYDHKRRE